MSDTHETPPDDSDLEQAPFLPPGEDPDESDLEKAPFLPPGEDPDDSDDDS